MDRREFLAASALTVAQAGGGDGAQQPAVEVAELCIRRLIGAST